MLGQPAPPRYHDGRSRSAARLASKQSHKLAGSARSSFLSDRGLITTASQARSSGRDVLDLNGSLLSGVCMTCLRIGRVSPAPSLCAVLLQAARPRSAPPTSQSGKAAGRRPVVHVYLAILLMFRCSVTSQVLSASLAEFNKEIEPAPMHVVQHFVHGPIRSKVGLSDRVECTLGSRDDWSR